MQDNGGEAHKFGLVVPVVMIRRDDGIHLLQWPSSFKPAENASPTTCKLIYRAK